MESREESPPHDPNDPRGGGGPGGGFGTEDREKWTKSEEARKAEGEGAGERSEAQPESSAAEGDLRP